MTKTDAERSFGRLRDAVSSRLRDDPYAWIREATNAHRQEHQCWAYPYKDGTILGAIGSALRPQRVLELGTALGYTASWWAQSGATVTSIEADPIHVRLAKENIHALDMSARVEILNSSFEAATPQLPHDFNLVFFDGYEPSQSVLTQIQDLLHPSGMLVLTNLDLGTDDFRKTLACQTGWRTDDLEDLAISRRASEKAA